MSKMRVHELAKELDIKSSDIIEVLGEKGIDVKAQSSIDEASIEIVKKKFPSAKSENKKEEKVYSLLDEIHPMTFENLLENSGFSAFELQHILMKFELKNIIYQIEQNVYLRKVWNFLLAWQNEIVYDV